MDTSGYSWTYNEYRDLVDSNIFFGGATIKCFTPNLDLILIEVFDSTALARIQYSPFLWMKPEVGDLVRLK